MSLRTNSLHEKAKLVRLTSISLAIFGLSMSCGQVAPGDAGPEDDHGVEPDGFAGGPTGTGGGTGGGAADDDGAGGDGSGAGGSLPKDPLRLLLNGTPLESGFVRLTHAQWQKTVRDIFELRALPADLITFKPDASAGAFSNNEKSLIVGEQEWTDHQAGAEQIAAWVAGDEATVANLGGLDDPRQFIASVGRRAFRRALSDAELGRYEKLWSDGAAASKELSLGSAGADGARVFLETLLQSPHFLYRIELSPAGDRLSGLELATKLSLLLNDTSPSDALLDAAEAGELDENSGLAAWAELLLGSESSTEVLVRFHRELYQLDRYATAEKDTTLFPDYSPEFNRSIAQADELLFAHLYKADGGLRALFTTPTAFIDAETAPYYGIEAPASGYASVELEGRPGFLTRLGFLASHATPSESNPIQRGLFILKRMMCAKFEAPSTQIPVPPPREADQTTRAWITDATSGSPCAECHETYINPLGFAFENFDAVGQVRTEDNGSPIDTSGGFPFSEGHVAFAGASELVEALAEDRLAHECYSARMTEYVLARDLHAADEDAVLEAARLSHDEDASMQSLLLELVQSPLFTDAQ